MQVMSWLGRQYSKLPVKVAVMIVYLGVLAAGIYGTSQMRVDADIKGAFCFPSFYSATNLTVLVFGAIE